MRSAPSAADRNLIARLAEEDLQVTPTQLERWRQLGLIPRARVVRHAFGGSAVSEHDEDVVISCAVLSQVSSRGRPWQYSALALFEEGQTLSPTAVRGAAGFLLERQLSDYRRAWNRAEVGADGTVDDRGEWVADVATEATRYVSRLNLRAVREDVTIANPSMSQGQLREAAHSALIWRIADVNVPTLLSPRQRQWARTGSDEPLDPLLGPTIPLPSERAACVATLTWAEAALARWQLVVEEFPLEGRWLLDAATWRVTAHRLREDLAHPECPLDSEALMAIRDGTVESLEEQQETSGDP